MPSPIAALSCRTAMLLLAAVLPAVAMPAQAQETVVPETSTRVGYAQVLRVEPVFQTLRATRMEQQCDGKTIPPQDPPHGLSKLVDAVKGAFGGDDRPADVPPPGADCKLVPVEREFRRAIAYDVDFVFKGMKYRSRLPYDPGNRLRVEFSLTPYIPPPPDAAAQVP